MCSYKNTLLLLKTLVERNWATRLPKTTTECQSILDRNRHDTTEDILDATLSTTDTHIAITSTPTDAINTIPTTSITPMPSADVTAI